MRLVEAIRRANAAPDPEESVALRAAVLVAVWAAGLSVVGQGVGGPALRLVALVGIPAGFVYSHLTRTREKYVVKALLAAGVLVAFAVFLGQLGRFEPGAVNEMQLPLAELFLWVQFFHSIDVPARRDLLFSLLSSLVLVAVAGVLSLSGGLGPYLAVWAVASLVSLVLAHRSEVRGLPGLRGASVPGGAGPVPAVRAWLRPVVALVALTVVVAGAVFVVVPAAGAGRAVAFPARLPASVAVPRAGGLANPSLGGRDPASADGRRSSTGTGPTLTGYFGFSTTLDTALRGRPDDTMVMRVKAGRPDFWRGQSFDSWDGRVWEQTDQRPRAVVSGSAPIDLRGAAEDRTILSSGSEFAQTVYVEEPGPNIIFAAYAPSRVYFGDPALFELSDGTVRTGVHLPRGSVYTVVSRRPAVTEDLLQRAGTGGSGLTPDQYARYTQLPEVPQRVRDLAAGVTAGLTGTYDRVRALEGWMAANTSYTLDIPPLPEGADAVEQFLFEDRQGFCEQIGSALVVMLRSLGVPSRLAVGYTPGQRNPFTGLWEVRARDAHSWAEVWFPGVGWQSFDPTASVPLAGDPYSGAAGAGLGEFLRARLPSVPSWLAQAVVVVVSVALPAWALGVVASRRRHRRRARAAMAWSDLVLERLEAAGALRGRSRREWETASRYADTLARSVLPDPRLRSVAEAVEAGAFAPGGLAPDRREEVEALLGDIESAHPV